MLQLGHHWPTISMQNPKTIDGHSWNVNERWVKKYYWHTFLELFPLWLVPYQYSTEFFPPKLGDSIFQNMNKNARETGHRLLLSGTWNLIDDEEILSFHGIDQNNYHFDTACIDLVFDWITSRTYFLCDFQYLCFGILGSAWIRWAEITRWFLSASRECYPAMSRVNGWNHIRQAST